MTAPIGFVGAGVMGSHLVRRLLDRGDDVLVFARTPARVASLIDAGAEATNELRDVHARCDVVVGCLLDDAAVQAVYLGAPNAIDTAQDLPDSRFGLVSDSRPGQVFVEHGTFSPAVARRISGVAAERGARFIDAPVTGGPEGAAAGTLVVMAGAGQSTGVDQPAADPAGDSLGGPDSLRTLVGAYSRDLHITGPVGSGLQLKLVNQLLVTIHMAAAAEAAALLAESGIAPDVAMAVLNAGWAASAMLRRELPLALSGDVTNRGATIGGLVHLQDMIATAFADAGISPRLFPTAQSLFAEAAHDGLGESDPAALVQLYSPPGGRGARANARSGTRA